MRRVPTTVTLMAILAGSASMATAQVSCQQFGNQTYCSNGQNFQQFGNHTYDNRGNSWQDFGNQTYGSNGTVCQRFGSSTYCR
jgi:hypothetical protein